MLLFVLLLIELVLFLMALIFGSILGYESTLRACFWLGIVVGICFILIVLVNVIVIFFHKLYVILKRTGGHEKQRGGFD
jgi:hypothetical protein